MELHSTVHVVSHLMALHIQVTSIGLALICLYDISSGNLQSSTKTGHKIGVIVCVTGLSCSLVVMASLQNERKACTAVSFHTGDQYLSILESDSFPEEVNYTFF